MIGTYCYRHFVAISSADCSNEVLNFRTTKLMKTFISRKPHVQKNSELAYHHIIGVVKVVMRWAFTRAKRTKLIAKGFVTSG